MEKKLYSSGKFAQIAHVSKKTLRYYHQKGILNPSYTSDSNIFYYSEEDFSKLQFILLLKSLGFSLEDIKEISLRLSDTDFLDSSLKLQLKFIDEKITQLSNVKENLEKSIASFQKEQKLDWNNLLSSTDLSYFDEELKNQYLNSSNIESRISLHQRYSNSKIDWFSFLFQMLPLKENMKVLEIGCGDGSLWKDKSIPRDCSIILSDVSNGMLKDAKANLPNQKFAYKVVDLNDYKEKKETYDLIIANHVLFYANDVADSLKDIASSLKKGGYFFASCYSKKHMQEITSLVQGFDERIVLSKSKLYEIFGKDNGEELLKKEFSKVEWLSFEDFLFVKDPNAIIQYVLSCHGNQNKYIVDKFNDFKVYIKEKVGKGIKISKDAGIFICQK